MKPTELFKCETDSFTVHSLGRQPRDFALALSERDWTSFAAVAELFVAVLHGEPAVGRIQKVAGAAQKLYELRITPRGGKGPQLRMLCAVDGRRILCARGVDKRQPRLNPRDVELADKAVADHFRGKDERARGKRKPKGG